MMIRLQSKSLQKGDVKATVILSVFGFINFHFPVKPFLFNQCPDVQPNSLLCNETLTGGIKGGMRKTGQNLLLLRQGAKDGRIHAKMYRSMITGRF